MIAVKPAVYVTIIDGDPNAHVDVINVQVLSQYAGNENIIDPKEWSTSRDAIKLADNIGRHDDAPASTILGVVLARIFLTQKRQMN